MHRAVLSLIEVPILASVKFINSKKKSLSCTEQPALQLPPCHCQKNTTSNFFLLTYKCTYKNKKPILEQLVRHKPTALLLLFKNPSFSASQYLLRGAHKTASIVPAKEDVESCQERKASLPVLQQRQNNLNSTTSRDIDARLHWDVTCCFQLKS